MNFLSLQNILLMTPILFIALPVHELAHGWVAFKLGDPTAKNAGRLTLNPFKHLDFIGVLMMYAVGFGWAKPVPVNFSNLKDRRMGTVGNGWPYVYICWAYKYIHWELLLLLEVGVITITTERMLCIYIHHCFSIYLYLST